MPLKPPGFLGYEECHSRGNSASRAIENARYWLLAPGT